MIDYSSRNFKKIVEKIQSEANGIRSLIAENEFDINEGFVIDDCKVEIQMHFMVIKGCTKLLEEMLRQLTTSRLSNKLSVRIMEKILN